MVRHLAVVALGAVQRRPFPTGPRAWRLIGLLALTNAGVALAAMFAGVAGLATGTAAVLANTQPLLILLPAWWFYGERLPARSAAGLTAGFAGLLVVAVPAGGGTGAWLWILAAAAITTGTLLARRLSGVDVVQAAGWHFVLGRRTGRRRRGGGRAAPHRLDPPPFVVALEFLALAGTDLAFWVWFVETLRSPLAPLAAWTFLTPVFGVVFSVLAGDEPPGGWTAGGLSLVLVSLWLVPRPPAPAATAPPRATR